MVLLWRIIPIRVYKDTGLWKSSWQYRGSVEYQGSRAPGSGWLHGGEDAVQVLQLWDPQRDEWYHAWCHARWAAMGFLDDSITFRLDLAPEKRAEILPQCAFTLLVTKSPHDVWFHYSTGKILFNAKSLIVYRVQQWNIGCKILGKSWIVIHKVLPSFHVFDVFKAELLEMLDNKRMWLFSNIHIWYQYCSTLQLIGSLFSHKQSNLKQVDWKKSHKHRLETLWTVVYFQIYNELLFK